MSTKLSKEKPLINPMIGNIGSLAKKKLELNTIKLENINENEKSQSKSPKNSQNDATSNNNNKNNSKPRTSILKNSLRKPNNTNNPINENDNIKTVNSNYNDNVSRLKIGLAKTSNNNSKNKDRSMSNNSLKESNNNNKATEKVNPNARKPVEKKTNRKSNLNNNTSVSNSKKANNTNTSAANNTNESIKENNNTNNTTTNKKLNSKSVNKTPFYTPKYTSNSKAKNLTRPISVKDKTYPKSNSPIYSNDIIINNNTANKMKKSNKNFSINTNYKPKSFASKQKPGDVIPKSIHQIAKITQQDNYRLDTKTSRLMLNMHKELKKPSTTTNKLTSTTPKFSKMQEINPDKYLQKIKKNVLEKNKVQDNTKDNKKQNIKNEKISHVYNDDIGISTNYKTNHYDLLGMDKKDKQPETTKENVVTFKETINSNDGHKKSIINTEFENRFSPKKLFKPHEPRVSILDKSSHNHLNAHHSNKNSVNMNTSGNNSTLLLSPNLKSTILNVNSNSLKNNNNKIQSQKKLLNSLTSSNAGSNLNKALDSIFFKNSKVIDRLQNRNTNTDEKVVAVKHKALDKSKITKIYLNDYEGLRKYITEYYDEHNSYPDTDMKFYKFGRQIGHGAFGKVNIALHIAAGRLVALKSFNKKSEGNNESNKRKLLLETQLMKTLKHSHIVRIYETFETDKYLFIILEYVNGGDLLSFVRKRTKLKERIAKVLFKQLIEALKYMHSQGVIHRDIKLDNILIGVGNEIKICDFGVSKLVRKDEINYEQCGTPAYMAPELLAGEGYKGPPVDVWSSGVVLYALLSGSVPFKGNNLEELEEIVLNGEYKKLEDISPEAEDLINKIFVQDPAQRMTTDQILAHQWFKNCDNKKDIQLYTGSEESNLKKSLLDYRTAGENEALEQFTLSNLNTITDEAHKNIHTKSVILGPYPTKLDKEELKDEDYVNNNLKNDNLEVNNNLMQINAVIREANKNYEANINGQKDIQVLYNDHKGSFNLESSLYKEEDENNLSGEIQHTGEKALDNIVNKRGSIRDIYSMSLTSKDSNFSTDVIKQVADLGFTPEYILKCLKNQELNYCTSCYYLLRKADELGD